MSHKMYQIKNSDGKFLNVENKYSYTTDVFWRASYFSSYKIANIVIEKSGASGMTISETTEEEYTRAIASETTNVCIQLDSIYLKLDKFNYSIPTMSKLNKTLSVFIKNASNQLKKVNPHFEEFLKKKEDQTFEVVEVYEDFISEVSTVEMWECNDLARIIRMYKKDSSSILGIVSKLEKHHK